MIEEREKIIQKFLRDAIIAFGYWTGVLTPYMIFIVRLDLAQYLAWLSMQAILIPPLGAISAKMFRWIDSRKKKNGTES